MICLSPSRPLFLDHMPIVQTKLISQAGERDCNGISSPNNFINLGVSKFWDATRLCHRSSTYPLTLAGIQAGQGNILFQTKSLIDWEVFNILWCSLDSHEIRSASCFNPLNTNSSVQLQVHDSMLSREHAGSYMRRPCRVHEMGCLWLLSNKVNLNKALLGGGGFVQAETISRSSMFLENMRYWHGVHGPAPI